MESASMTEATRAYSTPETAESGARRRSLLASAAAVFAGGIAGSAVPPNAARAELFDPVLELYRAYAAVDVKGAQADADLEHLRAKFITRYGDVAEVAPRSAARDADPEYQDL